MLQVDTVIPTEGSHHITTFQQKPGAGRGDCSSILLLRCAATGGRFWG